MKICACCGQPKTNEEFHKKSANSDGLRNDCKACAIAKFHEYKARNPQKVLDTKRRWYENNKERAAASYQKYQQNRPRMAIKQAYRAHYDKHYAQLAIKWTMRRMWCAKATPVWANHESIAGIYRQAGRMRQAGFDVHVDHVVPLRGKNVCGLHVHNNLQIIPAKTNLQKGNRLLQTG